MTDAEAASAPAGYVTKLRGPAGERYNVYVHRRVRGDSSVAASYSYLLGCLLSVVCYQLPHYIYICVCVLKSGCAPSLQLPRVRPDGGPGKDHRGP